MDEHGVELGPRHTFVPVRKTGWEGFGWGLGIRQEAAVKSREGTTTRGWIEDGGDRMVGKDATFQVGPGPCQPLGKKPAPQKSRAGGQEVNVQELPCLLGIRHLLTHLEPLVHPKYTPAKKVTMETMVSSGSLPHIQTQWRGTALPRPFPMSIHPAAALLEKRAAPSPRGAWVGKVGPLRGQSQLSCRSAWGCSGG